MSVHARRLPAWRARGAVTAALGLLLVLMLAGCREQRAEDFADLGRQALAQDDHNAAVAAYERSIKLHPTAEAYLGLGIAYDLKGNTDKALLNLNLCLQLDPNNAVAYYRRGNVLGSLGNYTGALSDFSRAIALNPQYAEAYLSRGATMLELGSTQRAREDLFNALALTRDPAMRMQIERALRATESR